MDSNRQKKPLRKRASLVLVALLALPVLLGVLVYAYRSYKQKVIRDNTRITQPMGIESLEKVTLGGLDQWLLIRAEDRSNPVLLWLHGGPGSPTMPLASQHDMELVKHFVLSIGINAVLASHTLLPSLKAAWSWISLCLIPMS